MDVLMELVCLGRISYVIPFQDLVLIYCKKDIDLSMLNYNLDLYYSFNVFKDGSCMHYREPMITTYDYYEIVVISPCQPSLWWNKSTYQTLPSPSSSSISKKESGQVVRSHPTTSHTHSHTGRRNTATKIVLNLNCLQRGCKVLIF